MLQHPAFCRRIQKLRLVGDFYTLVTVEVIRTIHKFPVSLVFLMFALPHLSEVRQGQERCDQKRCVSL